MSNSKHSSRDIFAVIESVKRSLDRRAHAIHIDVRAHVNAESTRTSMTIEVFNTETDAVLCVFEIPRILDIEDSGDTLGILNGTPVPAITLVSDGTSTIECHRELPGQHDSDINGPVLYTDEIALALYEEISSFAK